MPWDGLACGLTSSVAELTAKLQQAEGAGGKGDARREVLLAVYEHLQDAFLPHSADSTAQDTFTPPEVRSLGFVDGMTRQEYDAQRICLEGRSRVANVIRVIGQCGTWKQVLRRVRGVLKALASAASI